MQSTIWEKVGKKPVRIATDRLVVLAAGLGTRMRKTDQAAQLDAQQSAVADSGVKALIPIDRPFLDYVLTVAADAGLRKVCLVIGKDHHHLRDYYANLGSGILTFDFAVQAQPLGTANAVAAAEQWCAGEPFVMINSDNYYPAVAFKQLLALAAPGVALFDRDAMLAGSNIPADRIEKFAIAEIRGNHLSRIIEKPSTAQMETTARQAAGRLYFSMNLWLLNSAIFQACREIPKSRRGEFEITDAVQYSIDRLNQQYAVARIQAAVLDLSSRSDIASVTAKLQGTPVRL